MKAITITLLLLVSCSVESKKEISKCVIIKIGVCRINKDRTWFFNRVWHFDCTNSSVVPFYFDSQNFKIGGYSIDELRALYVADSIYQSAFSLDTVWVLEPIILSHGASISNKIFIKK